MKKFFTLIAAVAMAASVNAQTLSFDTDYAAGYVPTTFTADGLVLKVVDTNAKLVVDPNSAYFGTADSYQKTCRNYPAVLIGRLGVNKKIHSKHVGSEIINFIKYWFVEPNNKTGCRFVLVDAYNNPFTIKFYESNGFKMMFSNEEQEKQYRRLKPDSSLNTRIMYFDLINLC
jgi:GNAT superfamily N-acetyltransferase